MTTHEIKNEDTIVKYDGPSTKKSEYDVSSINYNFLRIAFRDKNEEIMRARNNYLIDNIDKFLNNNIVTDSIINDPVFSKFLTNHDFKIKRLVMEPIVVKINESVAVRYTDEVSNERDMLIYDVDINYIGFHEIIMPSFYKFSRCKCNNKNVVGLEYNDKIIYGGDYYVNNHFLYSEGFKKQSAPLFERLFMSEE